MLSQNITHAYWVASHIPIVRPFGVKTRAWFLNIAVPIRECPSSVPTTPSLHDRIDANLKYSRAVMVRVYVGPFRGDKGNLKSGRTSSRISILHSLMMVSPVDKSCVNAYPITSRAVRTSFQKDGKYDFDNTMSVDVLSITTR